MGRISSLGCVGEAETLELQIRRVGFFIFAKYYTVIIMANQNKGFRNQNQGQAVGFFFHELRWAIKGHIYSQ